MHNLESALSNAQEKQSMLEKLWQPKSARKKLVVDKILCFVDANDHSVDAILVSSQLSKEFECEFSLRSLFDEELKKITAEDLSHLKQSIIEIVKGTGVNRAVTFLEGDAIESVSHQLIDEYDILVLPVPYHSNLSHHPEAVALGSLGEFLIRKSEKPLILVPENDEKKNDLFSSIIIVGNDVSDIIQNENYINAISRNRTHLHFIYMYDARDIELLAEASKGIVDVDLVKKRIDEKMHQYGKITVDRFNEQIESVEYSIINENFNDNIQSLIQAKSASLLIIILPENVAGHQYLLYQEMLRDKKIQLPTLILRINIEESIETKEDEINKNEAIPEDEVIPENQENQESDQSISTNTHLDSNDN